MSQRSAFSAAASATAEVSEPPRPSVVMRLSGPDALEARDHRDLALAHAADELARLDIGDARLAVHAVGADRDLPAEPGARIDPERLQRQRHQPGGHLLAGRDDDIVFARVVQRLACRVHPTSWLVAPAIAETTTATSLPASTSRLTRRATP